MPNDFASPDALIDELQTLAAESEPADALTFGAEARDDLAAYREQLQLASRSGREASPDNARERQRRAIVVPEAYEPQAEFFLVFDTFVRFFIHPIIVASAIPELVSKAFDEQQITRIAFRRFGEEMQTIRDINELLPLSKEAFDLIEIAGELGRALFGDRFRASDFWNVS